MNALFPAPAETIDLRVLSLGAGVQSTALALMAAHGEIGPMPDCAIFADTGWEPRAVHEHLAWLRSPDVLPFPVHVVSAGNIRDGLVRGARGERWASIPAFMRRMTCSARLPKGSPIELARAYGGGRSGGSRPGGSGGSSGLKREREAGCLGGEPGWRKRAFSGSSRRP